MMRSPQDASALGFRLSTSCSLPQASSAVGCGYNIALFFFMRHVARDASTWRRLAPLLPEQEHHLITVVFVQWGPETLAVQLRARDDVRQAKVSGWRQEGV